MESGTVRKRKTSGTRTGVAKKKPGRTAATSGQTARKKSRGMRMLVTGMILTILTLVAVIVILDQRAMKKGHVGLWESVTGIRPAVTAQDVEKATELTMAEFGITRARLIREGRTTMKNRGNELLEHRVFAVPDTDTFQRLTARFEDMAGRNGVTVHNRHVLRQPHEWVLSYYLGTHGNRTHKYEFRYTLIGTPAPATDPGILQEPGSGDPAEADSGSNVSGKPRIALIFDDFGSDKAIAERFLEELDIPVTLAVIPYQTHSREIILMTSEAGQTPFLHVPMEPLNADAMGSLSEHYLMVSYDDATLRSRTARMLDDHKGVKGVNNHTGSRLTADRRAMDAVLAEIRQRKLVFVDSRTTTETVAETAAREMGIPTASRRVFIDQGYNGGDVAANMLKLAEIARQQGSAIGIGHAIDDTLDQLKTVLSGILQSGVTVVPVLDLVN